MKASSVVEYPTCRGKAPWKELFVLCRPPMVRADSQIHLHGCALLASVRDNKVLPFAGGTRRALHVLRPAAAASLLVLRMQRSDHSG